MGFLNMKENLIYLFFTFFLSKNLNVLNMRK